MRRRLLREWVPVGRQGLGLDTFLSLSLYDRWHLQKAALEYLEWFYSGGSLTPED